MLVTDFIVLLLSYMCIVLYPVETNYWVNMTPVQVQGRINPSVESVERRSHGVLLPTEVLHTLLPGTWQSWERESQVLWECCPICIDYFQVKPILSEIYGQHKLDLMDEKKGEIQSRVGMEGRGGSGKR